MLFRQAMFEVIYNKSCEYTEDLISTYLLVLIFLVFEIPYE